MDHSRRTALKSLAVASATVAARAQGNSVDQDTVHLDDGHQVIDNFAASDCWSMQKVGGWSMETRQRVANLLFSDRDGIALSCWRFNIGGGINPQITDSWRTAETFEVSRGKYDWSRQPNERWFLGAAKSLGVPQFLAFVNSPPGRLTRNGLTFCDPGSGTTNLKPGAEDEYGRYLGDILEHFAHAQDPAERISFDYISPVNEPQWDWSKHAQEGNRASNRDIKAIIQAVALELEKRRLSTQIASLESGSLPDMWQVNKKSSQRWGGEYGNYIDSFLGDPGVNGLMSGRIGYHAYGSDRLDGALVTNREQLGKKMEQYPSWKLWQTEYCVMEGSEGEGGGGRDLTMKTAGSGTRDPSGFERGGRVGVAVVDCTFACGLQGRLDLYGLEEGGRCRDNLSGEDTLGAGELQPVCATGNAACELTGHATRCARADGLGVQERDR